MSEPTPQELLEEHRKSCSICQSRNYFTNPLTPEELTEWHEHNKAMDRLELANLIRHNGLEGVVAMLEELIEEKDRELLTNLKEVCK